MSLSPTSIMSLTIFDNLRTKLITLSSRNELKLNLKKKSYSTVSLEMVSGVTSLTSELRNIIINTMESLWFILVFDIMGLILILLLFVLQIIEKGRIIINVRIILTRLNSKHNASVVIYMCYINNACVIIIFQWNNFSFNILMSSSSIISLLSLF